MNQSHHRLNMKIDGNIKQKTNKRTISDAECKFL